jgi:hypothetical protein
MSASNVAERDMANFITGATVTAPTVLYLALYTSAPDDATAGTEVSGSNYSRVNVGIGSVNWTAAGINTAAANKLLVTFATPSGSWGTVTHWALWNHATDTTVDTYRIWWGVLSASITPGTNDTVKVAIGALTLSID